MESRSVVRALNSVTQLTRLTRLPEYSVYVLLLRLIIYCVDEAWIINW